MLRGKALMPDHKVQFTIPFRELGRADIIFKVYAQENEGRREEEYLIGTLLVSHGAVEWRSSKKKHKVKLGWSDFDRLMLEKRGRK